MKQWKCPTCGEWIAADWWRHCHVKKATPTTAELIAARNRGVDLIDSAAVDTYLRTGDEEMREEP